MLFPWVARVFDRDLAGRKEARIDPAQTEGASFSNIGTGRDVKGKAVPYYQVLVDARDCPYIRAQSETVTFLGHQESSRSLYAIPGYVLIVYNQDHTLTPLKFYVIALVKFATGSVLIICW